LELLGVSSLPSFVPWQESPVGTGKAIVGFHSATALLNSLDETQALLTNVMGMEAVGRENNRHRFVMSEASSAGHILDVIIDPHAGRGKPGAGTVHHIAFRSRSDEEQLAWRRQLVKAGVPVTDVRNRKYFRSIYFHEPGGVLLEIATDPPGFTVDEPLETLGRSFKLPSQYQAMRGKIVASLPPLRSSEFHHEFWRPEQGAGDGQTIIPLHGTGRSEKDLLPKATLQPKREKVLFRQPKQASECLWQGITARPKVLYHHFCEKLSTYGLYRIANG